MKRIFDVDLFFKSLLKKDIYKWVNSKYSKFENPTKSFAQISKELRFIPLIQIMDNEPEGAWVSKKEIGYLYSKKSKLSFIIITSFFHTDKNNDLMENGRYDEWLQPEVLLTYKNFKNKNFKDLPKFLLDYLVKKKILKGNHCNLVNLNNKFKWNKDALIKAFKKCVKAKFEEKRQHYAL